MSDVHNTFKKDLGVGAKQGPGTLSSTPGKVLKPRKPALRTEEVSYMNPAEHHSLLDSKTGRMPVSNTI